MNITKLAQPIVTKQDQNKLIDLLGDFSQSLYNLTEDPMHKVDAIFDSDTKKALLEFLEDNKISIKDPIALEKIITEVKKEIMDLPAVTLEIAVEPKQEILATIQAWFSLSLPQKYIVDIQVNKKLIGAACVRVNGKYKDYSLKRRLEETSFNDVIA